MKDGGACGAGFTNMNGLLVVVNINFLSTTNARMMTVTIHKGYPLTTSLSSTTKICPRVGMTKPLIQVEEVSKWHPF